MLCRIKSYGSYGWYTYKQELEENREKSKCYNTETNIWVFKNVFRYLSKTKWFFKMGLNP